MKRAFSSVFIALLFALGLNAQTAPDAAELTKLLNEFLAGASRDDADIHDRFWADDLIYTGSTGRRVGKADILKDLRTPPTVKSDELTTYSAEDIRIQQYGDTAIVAFLLVAKIARGDKVSVSRYLNSGTFLKRKGKWQVVNWQATKFPRAEVDAKREIAMVEADLQQATLKGNVKALAVILDEGFVWTRGDGQQLTGAQLIEHLKAGRLKYASLETNNVTVSLHGETAVVRGVTIRQRSAMPGTGSPRDAAPFTAYYTITFVNKSGAWKAVAMHTSRQ